MFTNAVLHFWVCLMFVTTLPKKRLLVDDLLILYRCITDALFKGDIWHVSKVEHNLVSGVENN